MQDNEINSQVIKKLIEENEHIIESYEKKIQILDRFIDKVGLRKEFDQFKRRQVVEKTKSR